MYLSFNAIQLHSTQKSPSGPWKGLTFQPGASLQLNNFYSQKNEAALGNCTCWESQVAPHTITSAMWVWGCWNRSLHSEGDPTT